MQRGRIWFIGGPLDNTVADVDRWAELVVFRGDKGQDYFYELTHLSSEWSAKFFAYIHDSLSRAERVQRVCTQLVGISGFNIRTNDLERRIAKPRCRVK